MCIIHSGMAYAIHIDILSLAHHLICHRFSPFNCCLSVVLLLDKVHVVFCPNKQRSFELLCV